MTRRESSCTLSRILAVSKKGFYPEKLYIRLKYLFHFIEFTLKMECGRNAIPNAAEVK